jgi:hypothetical protein
VLVVKGISNGCQISKGYLLPNQAQSDHKYSLELEGKVVATYHSVSSLPVDDFNQGMNQ